jgi:hypothetical protein
MCPWRLSYKVEVSISREILVVPYSPWKINDQWTTRRYIAEPPAEPQFLLPIRWYEGRAIAEAVSRWLPTTAARVRARVWQVRFVVDEEASGQVFSEYFGFPCRKPFHFTNLLYTLLYVYCIGYLLLYVCVLSYCVAYVLLYCVYFLLYYVLIILCLHFMYRVVYVLLYCVLLLYSVALSFLSVLG